MIKSILLLAIALSILAWRLFWPNLQIEVGPYVINIRTIFHHLHLTLKNLINTIRLRNYFTKFEKDKIEQSQHSNSWEPNNSMILSSKAYKSFSKIKITQKNKLLQITMPCENYPELKEYLLQKLNKYLIAWLEIYYPEKHWSKPSTTIHYFKFLIIIKEK